MKSQKNGKTAAYQQTNVSSRRAWIVNSQTVTAFGSCESWHPTLYTPPMAHPVVRDRSDFVLNIGHLGSLSLIQRHCGLYNIFGWIVFSDTDKFTRFNIKALIPSLASRSSSLFNVTRFRSSARALQANNSWLAECSWEDNSDASFLLSSSCVDNSPTLDALPDNSK